MTTPVATVDAAGIAVPSYADVLAYYQQQYQRIYGADVYLGSDSQDGQLVALFAQGLHDANAMAAAVYNAFSPMTAQGVGLSSVVKVNGMVRQAGAPGTVDVTLTGTVGTIISNGAVGDGTNRWLLPATVTIPLAGAITVTATAATTGSFTAGAGTVTKILTPVYGWTGVTNPAAAIPGTDTETDAALRLRQALTVALPSRTVLEGMVGAVEGVAGVTRLLAYENDGNTTGSNGIPPHSVALVVEGGDVAAIAAAIAAKKAPGVYTHGTTSQDVTDLYGVAHTIRFTRPTVVPITMAVTIKALTGYNTAIGGRIQGALAAAVNALAIAGKLYIGRLYVPANLRDLDDATSAALGVAASDPATFEVESIAIARDAGTPAASNLGLAWNEAASCTASAVTLTVT